MFNKESLKKYRLQKKITAKKAHKLTILNPNKNQRIQTKWITGQKLLQTEHDLNPDFTGKKPVRKSHVTLDRRVEGKKEKDRIYH